MKLALPENTQSTKKEVILPFVPKDNPLTKTNSVNIDLLSNPADPTSTKVKVAVRVLDGNADVRTAIEWHRDLVTRVLPGLGLTPIQCKARVTMIQNLLKGTPLNVFVYAYKRLAVPIRLAAAEAANRDPDHADHLRVLAQAEIEHLDEAAVDESLQLMLKGCMPPKSLERVKRYLRREYRKPADMTIRVYYQHLQRINEDEIPRLPPFEEAKKFGPDDLIDILMHATPKSWHRKMDRQGRDSLEMTPVELVAFFEQLEQAEEHDTNSKPTDSKKKGGKKNNSSSKSSSNDGDKYCLIHGKGSHSSDECHKLKAEANRIKTGGSDSNYKGKNKKYKRSTDSDDKGKSDKELNALVKKAVKAGVKKELNAISEKKRKATSSDDDLGALDVDLKDFNYDEMDNLKIDSDDDFSV